MLHSCCVRVPGRTHCPLERTRSAAVIQHSLCFSMPISSGNTPHHSTAPIVCQSHGTYCALPHTTDSPWNSWFPRGASLARGLRSTLLDLSNPMATRAGTPVCLIVHHKEVGLTPPPIQTSSASPPPSRARDRARPHPEAVQRIFTVPDEVAPDPNILNRSKTAASASEFFRRRSSLTSRPIHPGASSRLPGATSGFLSR